MASSSNINLSSIKARLKKAEKSLESGSKSKIFNKGYMESHEQEMIAQAETLGISPHDIQEIMKDVSEAMKDASEAISKIYSPNSKFKPLAMFDPYTEYFAAITNISISIANFYAEIFRQFSMVTANSTKMFWSLFRQTDIDNMDKELP